MLEAVDYTTRYCLVGGGPASMVMARALIAEGVPFDWFERHNDLGGIWDIDNPGSPMYESAHFISSKYTSGFYGYPMPANYPDYPGWRQIKDYVQGFAARYGLYGRATLGMAVERAEAQPGDRWLVTLSTGEQRTYDGLVAAPGVTWHPNVAQLPGSAEFSGEIRHSASFRDGSELRGRRVLIGGAGIDMQRQGEDHGRERRAFYLAQRPRRSQFTRRTHGPGRAAISRQ